MTRRTLALALSLAVAACRQVDEPAAPDAPPDAAPEVDAAPQGQLTYVVHGTITPEVAGDPLPAALHVDVFDAWEDDHDPFPADAPVLASPPVEDGAFTATVTEDGAHGLVAGVLVDDAAGAPDLLVPTINDRRITLILPGGHGDADVDAHALSRARLAGWQASPATGSFDLEAIGVTVVTFLDHERNPEAGVYPLVGPEARVWFVSADGASIDADAESTTTSGRVIVFGALSIAGLDHPPTGDTKELLGSRTHELVGIGARPGAVFVETSSRY